MNSDDPEEIENEKLLEDIDDVYKQLSDLTKHLKNRNLELEYKVHVYEIFINAQEVAIEKLESENKKLREQLGLGEKHE